ncbi:MAG: histidinol dehydrogenase [Gammaproteobacteria bacterium]|jgi:histidinol dehydrogenase|nr:histidinol dehydrogenase [Gammaproteobacteria bacterium]MBT5203318.1 histidinol dehydrogenase [Gammaproteobacteria bacterium]MBT5600637.1 histidinol dehydrogenase [Gammaproteobacteria bacterium]MBT6244570.1 histidinol dehydrogenase [Gammaproteobacteria bacterium]
MIAILKSNLPDFNTSLDAHLALPQEDTKLVQDQVREILDNIKEHGDKALLQYCRQYDGLEIEAANNLLVSQDAIRAAPAQLANRVKDALQRSIERVRQYHVKEKETLPDSGWRYRDQFGNQLGQRLRPIKKVGIYAPGGKATYPSTIVMTAIPAMVAGVRDVSLAVPSSTGVLDPVLLAAAHYCGVSSIYMMGGAQAIAAFAYGTATIPRVDKICGPGNLYVATAKQQVYGDVGIDMIAGPSEVLIVADKTANIDWLVADMLAQAEHDELAQAIVVSASEQVLKEINTRLATAIGQTRRIDIVTASIRNRALLIHAESESHLADIVNRIAPEHLELAVDEPDQLLAEIDCAGAVFVGQHSPEVVGDYAAGPSHVLPTGGTARFASVLGVNDFQVRSSLIQCSASGVLALAEDAAVLAEQEGLFAHAESARFRLQG